VGLLGVFVAIATGALGVYKFQEPCRTAQPLP